MPGFGNRALARRWWLGAAVAGGFLIAALAVHRFLLRGELLAGRDVLRLALPDAAFLLECVRAGEWPLWLPNVFLGQPFAATLQSQAFYPPRVLLVLAAGPSWGVSLEQVAHALIAAWGAYAFARQLRLRPVAAFAAGVAFGFSPLFTELADTPNLVASAAWSGWIARAALRSASPRSTRRAWLRPAAALAVFVALSVLGGSPETVLWQAALAAALAWTAGRGPGVLKIAAGGLWGGALAGCALVPALELAALSSRAGSAARSLDWSASWAQLVALFWPLADQPRGAYWGPDQWLLTEVFVGTLVFTAALSTLPRAPASVRRRGFSAWGVLLLGALLAALLALGAHLPPSAWLLRLPPLQLFRYPAKFLVALAFLVAVLAGAGVARTPVLFRRLRGRPVWAVVPLGFTFVLAAGGFALWPPGQTRPGAALTWPWLPFWVGLSAAAIWLVPPAHRRVWLPRVLTGFLLLELATFQLAHAGTARALASDLARPSATARALREAGAARISVGVRSRALAPSGPVEVVRGLDDFAARSREALTPNRFVEDGLFALEGYGAPEPPRIHQFHLARRRAIYDLAGVTHFVAAEPPYADLELLVPGVFASSTALPRAFVVHRAEVLADDRALQRLTGPGRPARTTVFLAGEAEPLGADGCAGSSAELVAQTPNTLRVRANACAEGYLVVSDAWYPGWRAELAGQPVPVHRADVALRAVRIPAGASEVLFTYEPWTFTAGAGASLLALALLLLAAGSALRGRSNRPAGGHGG